MRALAVLAIDDEVVVLRTVKTVLEYGGYVVFVAQNAEEGLRLCNEVEGKLALVTSDVSMPGLNGRKLAKCAKSLHSSLHVILMSGYTSRSPLLQG